MCRIIFSVSTIVLMFGCTHIEKSDLTIRQWHYDNGRLMKVQEYFNDSIEQGTYLYYYPNGVLKDSAQITYGKFHGKRFLYHENGQLYKLTAYINDKYRDGITYRLDGILEYYRAYNYHEELVFIVIYDSIGKFIKYDGNAIYSFVLNDNYPIGKEFSIELLIADPPNCETKLTVSDWDAIEDKAISKTEYAPDQFNRVNYTRKQNPVKDMCILHIANIHDTINQNTISDTLVIKVDKKGQTSYTNQLHR